MLSVCFDYSRDANFVCEREVLQTKGQPHTVLNCRHLLIKMNYGPGITFTTKREKTMIEMSLINKSV